MLERLTRRALLAAGVALAATAVALPDARAEYPDQPIRVIVPTDPGGAMDGLARIFQRAFEETAALSQPLVIVNMAGAGGTVGTREIKDAEPDGYTIGFWHDGLVTSNAMGVVDYDHTAFEIIGVTGFADLGLAVSVNSEFESFEQLAAYAKEHPGEVTAAVNIGLPVHFVPMQVGEAAGVDFRFVQVGGGAKRYQSLVGGHTNFAMFSTSELVQWTDDLRTVLMLGEDRVEQLPDVPTALELGLDVNVISSRIWLAPKGTPEDRLEVIRDAFRTAIASEDVAAQMAEFGLEPRFIEPDVVLQALDRALADTLPLVEKAREIQE